ncbi:hypothetical protein GCM10010472_40230 [Pseudonocardia halophobica]|uniref:Uncharacterized protein n=1 Tax=Pseudonocardia halophobica TaxID=29401 RepID=A0A9W6P073_9PSEU|nr:hypothetical protein GCM10017577_65820 [Pseudonocardia halophobica]
MDGAPDRPSTPPRRRRAECLLSTGARSRPSATPSLTVAKRIEDDADLSLRLDGEWVAPWEVDESVKRIDRSQG